MADIDRDRVLELAEEALDRSEYTHAEEILAPWLDEDDPEINAFYGLALFYGGQFRDARVYLEPIHKLDSEHPEIACAVAVGRFYDVEPERAVELLRRVVKDDPEWAEGQYWLARVADWLAHEGEDTQEEADRAFAEAARLEPDVFQVPLRIAEEEFESVLEAAMTNLPDEIARSSSEVAIVPQPYPTREILEEGGSVLAPDLLGLYTGIPLPERSSFDSMTPPDVIRVFQRNLEIATKSPEQLREEIRVTLIHELGHYLGLEEDDMERLGID